MRNTQVQVEEIRNQKYARLGGMDERLKILKVSWNGWKVRNTEGQVARMEDRLHLRLGGRDER